MTKNNLRYTALLLSFLLFFSMVIPAFGNQSVDTLWSPSHNMLLTVSLNDKGIPQYSLQFRKDKLITLISNSSLGFSIKGQDDLQSTMKVLHVNKAEINIDWTAIWGQNIHVRNHFREMMVILQEDKKDKRELHLLFRLYDDGFAFRYIIPDNTQLRNFEITNELTEFALDNRSDSWWSMADYDTQEKEFSHTKLKDAKWVNTPFVIKTTEGIYMALHEAGITDYPAMTLKQNDRGIYGTDLVPWADGIRVKARSPLRSPWRVVFASETAAALLNSDLLINLNDPCRIVQTDWIHPMKYIGIWWGMHLGVNTWTEGPKHGATTSEAMRYIDFAKQHHIEGFLAEGWNRGWDRWGKDSAFDQTTAAKDFDLKAIAHYAEKNGISLIGHHETGGDVPYYEQSMERAFQLCKSLGIHAVKTGYAGAIRPTGEHHFGQYMVQHLQRVTEFAARYEIMLDVHETVKPSGLCRTWPNLMTGEGMRGMEWEAWSKGNTPEHTVLLPFMRGIAGPMDYTPGIFDILFHNRKEYTKWNGQETAGVKPRVHSTLCHQMALWVVLYSPMQMAADLPENYSNHPAFEFFENLSMNFIRSLSLDASIGEYVITARQQGNGNWVLAAINNEQKRTKEVLLSFLDPKKEYILRIYRDGVHADYIKNPTDFLKQEGFIEQFTRKDADGFHLLMPLAAGGGEVIEIKEVIE